MTYTETDIRLTREELQRMVVSGTTLKSVLFVRASFCPPILDDMMPDITRLMNSVAARFCDQTTPQLQHDELVGQARLKLAELLTKDHLLLQATRECFFKFLKSALNNQARSLVQKYRFTEKRTGTKPPPRLSRVYNNGGKPPEDDEDEEHAPREHHKNVELSLDDEELNIQVPDAGQCDEEAQYDELTKEYLPLLSEQERFVFHKMTHPGIKASLYAQEDAMRGKPIGKPLRIRITHEHMALEAGIPLKIFEDYVLSIRLKIAAYRAMSDQERHQLARRGALLAQLSEFFGLQVPPDTDDMLVRRILTIAARDQFQKLKDNPEIGEMLEEIGAKVPRIQPNNQLGCHGVLFQRNSRICMKCDLRKSCAVEAANVGLGKIVLSPRLLGSRQTRTPVILPRMADEPPPEATPEELDWLSYLMETFRAVKKNDGCVFYYADGGRGGADRNHPLFFVNAKPPYRLRLVNPSEALKQRLQREARSWFAPERAASPDIQALIDQHAEEQTHAHA